jgi:hypothetical protein
LNPARKSRREGGLSFVDGQDFDRRVFRFSPGRVNQRPSR